MTMTWLRCTCCAAEYAAGEAYTCPACGEDGILDAIYDYEAVGRSLTREALAGRPQDIWRYRELLPIGDVAVLPSLSVGWTPITEAPRLARELGVQALFLKDDGRNPSGSLKDRASAIAVVQACEQGQEIVACASTGNAASSLAGMAASMGLRSVIFVPKDTPEPKLTQLLVFGATVLRVDGSYFDAYQMCQKFCAEAGWYNRNSGINPWLIEGKKTAGLEIAEQMGERIPDWVVVSVGDGCTVAGIWKGLKEMHALGWIDRLPRMLGVQARGASSVVRAFQDGRPPVAETAATVADSIQVGYPKNWRKALTAIAESDGSMIAVEDEEILEAIAYTGRLTGVFAEPAASAGTAGLARAVREGIVRLEESALVMVTGNGLKDTASARRVIGKPIEAARDGAGLGEVFRREGLMG